MLRILLCLVMGILGCRAACNVCSNETNTVCVSETAFMFCEEALTIGISNNCPNGYYCTEKDKVCQSNSELAACSADPSSSTTESTTSTASTPIPVDPAIIDMCQVKASTGRHTNPNDTSCRSYVICFYRGNVWSGNVWKCPSTKPYFSSITSACGTIPSNCV